MRTGQSTTAIALAIGVAILGAAPGAATESPYAEYQGRTIKALSPQEIADLRTGRGMSMALPAELNGFPGPVHALDLADGLGLTDDQRQRLARLVEAMKREASALGEKVVQAEAHLDHLFADRQVTQDSLRTAVMDAGVLRAELRLAHLRYHLATVDILTAEQRAAYDRLRGYGKGGGHGHHKPAHH